VGAVAGDLNNNIAQIYGQIAGGSFSRLFLARRARILSQLSRAFYCLISRDSTDFDFADF
jgi:hypothetical protein